MKTNNVLSDRRVFNTKLVVTVGIFSAISFILQLIVPYKVSGFLDVEISDLPALILSLAYGPVYGIMVELVKNILHCFVTTTGYVGELANFVVNGSFCLVIGLVYKMKKTYKRAIISLVVGVIAMTIVSIFSNFFIMLPLYMANAPFDAKLNLVMTTMVPFNFIRGTVLAILTVLLYKKISKVIKWLKNFKI